MIDNLYSQFVTAYFQVDRQACLLQNHETAYDQT